MVQVFSNFSKCNSSETIQLFESPMYTHVMGPIELSHGLVFCRNEKLIQSDVFFVEISNVFQSIARSLDSLV